MKSQNVVRSSPIRQNGAFDEQENLGCVRFMTKVLRRAFQSCPPVRRLLHKERLARSTDALYSCSKMCFF